MAPMLRRFIAVNLVSIVLIPSALSQSAPVFEEVLVTAEKRSESLQDLSQAVTALTAMEVEERQLTSFVDLSAIAPGVNVAKNEGFKTVITIRGIGNEANQNAIANPSVSYHLDGVYIASPFALQTDFLDLEQIEVLRGPQGTLFGQNSTGGAINVVTMDPEFDEFSGTADVSLGQYKGVRARASMNIPLSDTLAARVSLLRNNHQGFTENVSKAFSSFTSSSMRVLSPRILPPESCEEGSTANTATLWPRLSRYMPKASIKVDLPTPGTPVMPIRILLPV
mgnify:CR=1 FL=1